MSHYSGKRFPNSSLAVHQQTFFYATETFAARHWASFQFYNNDENLQTGHLHTRQENIRDQSRTQRRKPLERCITSFDIHQQRIRLSHRDGKNKN